MGDQNGDAVSNPAKPRRRIIQVSDSDSDCDVHNVKDLPSPVKMQIDPAHNLKVHYLTSTFPKLQYLEANTLLRDVKYDLDAATERLASQGFTNTGIVSYKNWILSQRINSMQRNGQKRPVEKKNVASKAKRRKVSNDNSDSDEEKYKNTKVYDSDSDSDVEISNELTPMKRKVLEFMNTALPNELMMMHSCSKKKVEVIISVRPFKGWIDMIKKLRSSKSLSTNFLNAAQNVLTIRKNVEALMNKCSKIADQLEYAVKNNNAIKAQPKSLSEGMKLTSYQLVGINWLAILHEQGLNGILADEMGLGKTVQVVAFLTHLKERGIKGPHLVIVPASTLENWENEFERWSPDMNVVVYYGSAETRRNYRMQFANGGYNQYDVILTTYNLVAGTPEERKMFRVTPMNYVVFDEAHMLKNMNTQRFESLSRIRAARRLLLTGTPLQNNLLELMSLLIFVMPNIFSAKTDDLKSLFQKNVKKEAFDDNVPSFEKDQIEHAKRIMKPFVLRRLKDDVLRDLPKKTDIKLNIELIESQQEKYDELVAHFQEVGTQDDSGAYNGMSMMSDLRKLANHPLLMRYHYTYDDLTPIAQGLARDPDYKDTVVKYIVDDLACMSDFAINDMTREYVSIGEFAMPKSLIPQSGKFAYLDKKLPELKRNGHRVLIFSQYVIMLNILEQYLKIRNHSYLRLDGNTAVTERQQLINEYSNDESIFIFLLSTRAGGLGINLTAADTVIIHDIDFNPYNDKQAEDRCHRMGQKRPVNVYRLISKGTIEEGMFQMAQEKLNLEREITTEDYESTDAKSVVSLLSTVLKVDQAKIANLCSPEKIRLNGNGSNF